MAIEKHIDLLGYKAEDKVTGLKGVISTVSFDLFGCVQVIISPPAKEGGELPGGCWFDVTRLKVYDRQARVMPVPDFEKGYVSEGRKGAADKPVPQ